MIKRLKLTYAFYNFFQRRQLAHNVPLYRKIGLKKFYFSPVSSDDFVNRDSSLLNSETTNTPLTETDFYKEADTITKENILQFEENGYIIIKNYLSENQVDEINSLIDNGLKNQTLKFKNRNKIMFAIHQFPLLEKIGLDSKLMALLSSLMNGKAKLFQSINFINGSEQKTHSDSFHMTTFPLGGLVGVWVALEDIHMENGPLHYYRGSHKLPYYMNSDYNNQGNFLFIGDKGYGEYEKLIEKKIIEQNLTKEIFTAKKGDILIWHANLFHGAETHLDKSKTRKSMVFHYFNEKAICYHEITQRPSLFK
jgi:ectoine hydroxylase-related dioxygenase (phytanoyl-CoA dioxygenase family)